MRSTLPGTGMMLAAAMAALVTTSAQAGGLLFDETVAGCTAVNCSSLRLAGTVSNQSPFSPSVRIAPSVLQLWAQPGECLRLDVVSQDQDLKLTLVAPDATVWQNDDRNGARDRRPLVKVASPPQRGWYTVQLSTFLGDPLFSNYVLRYGRYAGPSNPNCTTPTAPQAVLAATRK